MIYKNFQGMRQSALVLETMRFPEINARNANIDEGTDHRLRYDMKCCEKNSEAIMLLL